MAENAGDVAHLIGHVKDADYIELPQMLGGHLYLPQPFEAIGLQLHLTKFMVLEAVAAILVTLVMVRVAQKISSGERPRGRFWNLFESMLLFIRDEVARPAIGHHDGDKFLPFLWTLFFFILFCNLLGMIPWMGSPTGAWGTTASLAIATFLVVCGVGIKKFGIIGFFKSLVPHMHLPGALAIVLLPMIFAIELLGLVIKHFVLSVRLLANMFAGHLVLAAIMSFIAVTADSALWYGVMPASVLGSVGLSLLELFVAFLQAYIFTFLSALFIGSVVHPH